MSHGADVPEADAAEQEREWKEDEESRPRSIPPDAPEADYLEQMRDADLDDEEERQ